VATLASARKYQKSLNQFSKEKPAKRKELKQQVGEGRSKLCGAMDGGAQAYRTYSTACFEQPSPNFAATLITAPVLKGRKQKTRQSNGKAVFLFQGLGTDLSPSQTPSNITQKGQSASPPSSLPSNNSLTRPRLSTIQHFNQNFLASLSLVGHVFKCDRQKSERCEPAHLLPGRNVYKRAEVDDALRTRPW